MNEAKSTKYFRPVSNMEAMFLKTLYATSKEYRKIKREINKLVLPLLDYYLSLSYPLGPAQYYCCDDLGLIVEVPSSTEKGSKGHLVDKGNKDLLVDKENKDLPINKGSSKFEKFSNEQILANRRAVNNDPQYLPEWAKVLKKGDILELNTRFPEYIERPYILKAKNQLILYVLWNDYIQYITFMRLEDFCNLFVTSKGKPVNFKTIDSNRSKILPELAVYCKRNLDALIK